MGKTLKDRVAVVVAAGWGVGRSIALRLADEGAAVLVNDAGNAGVEHAARAEAVAAEIRGRGGEAAADSGRPDDFAAAESIVDAAVRRFGRIDVLVNNCDTRRDGTILDLAEADWDAVISARLRSAFNCTRHASARMREQRHGRVISLASTAGLYGRAGQANHAAATDGIAGLTRVVSRDLGKYGITVNAVAIQTDEDPTASPPRDEEESAASLAAYLAGDAAGGINGQTFAVHGAALSLLNYPAPVRTITRAGRWSAEEIARLFPSTLGLDLVDPAPRSR